MKDERRTDELSDREPDDLAVANAHGLLGALAAVFAIPDLDQRRTANQHTSGSGELTPSASLELDIRYRTLLEQIPAVVFNAVLEDGRSEAYVSPYIEAVLGFSREEWLEDPVRWYNQIYPDDRSRWSIEAANFLLSGQPLRSVYRVQARDGHVVWFQCEAKMVRHPDGRPWFLHGVGFDITHLKETEEELKRTRDELEIRVQERTAELARTNAELKSENIERQRVELDLAQRAEDLARSNADLERFAYSASHDLQEPIRNVSMCAQLLARRGQDVLDAEGTVLLNTVIVSAKHMQQLVLDLLEYTHVANEATPNESICEASQVLTTVLQSLDATIRANGATIVGDRLPLVGLPAIRLQQLLQNLISNAIKYRSDEAPLIRVSATCTEQGWLFSVKDNGMGIAPKYHDRVFGLFKRLHTQAKYPGTGIGLAICKRIVENVGGKIWVESDEGKGADFRFTIPAIPPPKMPTRDNAD